MISWTTVFVEQPLALPGLIIMTGVWAFHGVFLSIPVPRDASSCDTQISPQHICLLVMSLTGVVCVWVCPLAVQSLGIPAAAPQRCLLINSSRLDQVKVPGDLLPRRPAP